MHIQEVYVYTSDVSPFPRTASNDKNKIVYCKFIGMYNNTAFCLHTIISYLTSDTRGLCCHTMLWSLPRTELECWVRAPSPVCRLVLKRGQVGTRKHLTAQTSLSPHAKLVKGKQGHFPLGLKPIPGLLQTGQSYKNC